MEAQVKDRLSEIKGLLKRCGYDIGMIRTQRWDQKRFPNHAKFMDAKRQQMIEVGERIVNHLEELAGMPGSASVEKVWAYGIRQLAIADRRAAAELAGTFKQGDRSTAGRLRAGWARLRGSTSYFMDDGN